MKYAWGGGGAAGRLVCLGQLTTKGNVREGKIKEATVADHVVLQA